MANFHRVASISSWISCFALTILAITLRILAIARALLRQPNILIFDEAVSNLDQSTSEQFAQTINRLKGKVTILFITHQLPKGLQVDEAVVLGKTEMSQDKSQSSSEIRGSE